MLYSNFRSVSEFVEKHCKITFATENVDTTAATDNVVSIQIIGEKGETGKLSEKRI